MLDAIPFDLTTVLAYSAACVLLIAAPGPGQALIIARTLSGGTRDGVLTAVGLQLGTLVHTVAAALGLSAILATSATAFAVVKYAGAAYLVVLGVILAVLGVIGDSAVAYAAGHARERFLTNPRFMTWRERVTGSMLIALGLRLAFIERH